MILEIGKKCKSLNDIQGGGKIIWGQNEFRGKMIWGKMNPGGMNPGGGDDMEHGLIKIIINKEYHLFYISIKRNTKILKSEHFNIYPNILF